jgi:hypothetical protein
MAEKVIASSIITSYPTRDEAMQAVQEIVAEAIRTGAIPEGAVVTDIRIHTVRFMVELPDGRWREMHACLIPDERPAKLDS